MGRDWKRAIKVPRQSFTRQTFHKILKSGCRAESSKLRTAERLVNLLSVFCILSWRVFWMTMMNRICSAVSPQIALTKAEIDLLDYLIKEKESSFSKEGKLSTYLIKIAKLGGYLARSSDPPPGNTVMWRGTSRLIDIELGFSIAMKAQEKQIDKFHYGKFSISSGKGWNN